MNNVIPFVRSFVGTHMSQYEIRDRARELGWPGIRIDARQFNDTGILIVERMSQKRARGNHG